MKKLSAVMLCVMMCFIASSSAWAKTVAINKTNFPDAVFREYVSNNFDTNKDGKLTDAEAKAVTNIYLSGSKLTNLKGIEYFTALTTLDCCDNNLTSLDVSKNTALTRLYCYNNMLTALNVSKNTALTSLSCFNNMLTDLNVSKNTALTSLSCYNNMLTKLDVSKCTALTTLDCYNNMLTALNVSKNTALTWLNCYNNMLTALNVSKCTALTFLSCENNMLTKLDVSKNTALTYLSCGDNKLTKLDVSKNTALTSLSCGDNKLTKLDVSKNTALTSLSCENNMLTSLNVKGCCRLSSLYCYLNRLTTLNVSQCISLSSLSCWSNRLTKLDVSNCGQLWSIGCDYNVQIVRTTKAKPTILTSSLPNATKGRDYRESLMAYGSLPISWTAKGLPAGLTCNKSGDITGAPTKTGTFNVTVTAKNSKGSASKTLTLKVGTAPTITTTSLKNGTKGKSYSVTFKATGSKTITWSAWGLPAGLTINKTTGKISGKPTESGLFYVQIYATNAYGSDYSSFNLTINASTSSSSTAVNEMNSNSSTEAQTPETSSDSLDGKSSRSGAGNSSPGLRAETQTDGYIIAHVFDEVISVDKAGLYDFDVELDEDTPEDWTLVWVANSSEPSDDDEIADFFNSEGTPIEVVPSDKKITVSVWLNPNREYEPAIAVKK